MQTQQIFGVSGGGMMFSAKSNSVKSSDNGFEQLIQMSQNSGAANEPVKKPVETKSESAADVETAKQPEQTADVSTEKKETSVMTEEQPEPGKAEGAEKVTDVEAAEKVAGLLNQIVELVKDVLDLSEEELNQFMEQLGITSAELIQPETLQNLVLMANSEQDAVVLLTDAKLLITVNDLIDKTEQLLQEAGVTSEELMGALENPDFEALVEEAFNEWNANNEQNEEEAVNVESTEVEQITTADKKPETAALATDSKETDNTDNKPDTKESTDVENFTEQFVQNLTKAADEISEITGQKDIVSMIREIADQILEKVRVSVTADTTSLEIVLTPEELGKVNLTVTAEQDGSMKARFVTENELAREAIERNLVQFKETLQEQGLKVDTIEVTVGNFTFDKNGQADGSSQEEHKNGGRRFMTDDEIGQKEETDQIAKVFMEGGESTVNYMA